jgi:hypothetical protein
MARTRQPHGPWRGIMRYDRSLAPAGGRPAAADGAPGKWPQRSARAVVEVLELTLHDDIYLAMGVRDSKGGAGEP